MKDDVVFLEKNGRYSGNKRLDSKAMGLEEPDADNDYTKEIWLESGEVQSDPEFHEEIAEKIDIWKQIIAITADPEKIVVHTVGESHIDCAWLWRYEQTRQKAIKTFRKAVLHAKMFPNKFNFALSEPLLLEWVKEDDPELFKDIQETVKNGGIELVGGSYVEPDCMMPSGEAFCRMRLYGMRFLRENFGVLPEVEWFLDSFGYNWGIPQILVKSGAKYFWTTKITWNYDTIFPFVNFWWEGPDGSRILTANFQMGTAPLDNWMKYEIGRHPLKKDGRKIWDYTMDYEEIDEHVEEDEVCPHVGNFFGKGDGGHGPTHQEVATHNAYCEHSMFKWSKVHDFYGELDKWSDRFPVWRDELYLENHRGTFSVHAEVKRHNRKNENKLTSLETLALFASFLTDEYKYPFDTFEWGWKTTLKNQFHDTLPGSSIPEVYDDCWEDWLAQEASYKKILREIGVALSQNGTGRNSSNSNSSNSNPSNSNSSNSNPSVSLYEDQQKSEIPVYLFNPVAWTRKSRIFIGIDSIQQTGVKIPLDSSGKPPYAKLVALDTNKSFICQPIAAEPENTIERMPAGWWVVPELKGVSITPCKLVILKESAKYQDLTHKNPEMDKSVGDVNNPSITIDSGFATISNDIIGAKIKTDTGAIVGLKSSGINGGANLVKGERSNLTSAWKDTPKNWPAWNLEHYWNRAIETPNNVNVKVSVKESGPVFATLEITKMILDNAVTQRITVFKDCSELFLEYLTDWQRPKTMLKVEYATTTNADYSVAEIAYGVIKRKTKPETPCDKARFEKVMHKYCDLSTPDNKWGIALLNEGKYAYDTEVDNETLRLTMLRSPQYPGPSGESWANLERKINREKFNHNVPECSGLGAFKCRYALLPHEGGALQNDDGTPNAIVKMKAEEFNQPVEIITTESIPAEYATKTFQLLDIKTPNVYFGTLKSNEWNKNGNIIARFVEGCGIASEAEVHFSQEMVDRVKSVKIVDILERPIQKKFKFDKSSGTLKFDMGKFEIVTFEFEI